MTSRADMTAAGWRLLDLLTTSEAAVALGCSPEMVRRLADAGELERVPLGSLARITPESVAARRQRLREAAGSGGAP
jgi:excisionase family DNA binding protein